MWAKNKNSAVETISVVIPTFNRAGFIERALLSVFNQYHKPSEVIVVDNGSTDETVDIIKSDFPQVKLIFEKKRGVSAARNTGIRIAKSKWIAFLDSDDEWHPDKLALQLKELEKPSVAARVLHTDETWVKNGSVVTPKRKHAKQWGDIFESCLKLCCISPSSIMLKKQIFADIGGFDENLPACEDYDMWLRICAIEPVTFLDKKLLFKYGGHDDQLSQKFWGMDRFRIYSIEKLISTSNLSVHFSEIVADINK